ncbi:MAG: hypothetical protein JO250_12385 [Armatimonadetes bacterium]|nr:hypothetical protein [Armatimonadota bacterium]
MLIQPPPAGRDSPALAALADLLPGVAPPDLWAALRPLSRAVVRDAYERHRARLVAEAGPRVDCLNRVFVSPAVPVGNPLNASGGACIALVVSPGYEGLLDPMLASLARYGGCPDVRRLVVCVDDEAGECRRVADRHGATVLPARTIARRCAAIKGALYSLARLWPVDAEHFLFLEPDMLIAGDLSDVFTALSVLHERQFLVARSHRPPAQRLPALDSPHDMAGVLTVDYYADPTDQARLTGEPDPPFFLFMNGGFVGASRSALLALDAEIEAMEPWATAWIEARPEIFWREEFVLSLAIARLRGVVEAAPICNALSYVHALDVRLGEGPARISHAGRPVRIVHFPGRERPLYAEVRALLGV